MSLVPSLLQAIVHLDGEALVLHVGEKPYVVGAAGQVDLSTRGLTLDAVLGIVNQLLPAELQQALDEFGATQYALPAIAEYPGELFTIVAARSADDVWAEIRRRRIPEDDRVPIELFTPTAAEAASGVADTGSAPEQEIAAAPPVPDAVAEAVQAFASESAAMRGEERRPEPAPMEPAAPGPAAQVEAVQEPVVNGPTAVVLPMSRSPIRAEAPPQRAETTISGLDALLRLASIRGASTMYLSSGARPSVRVDGDIQTLEGTPVLAAGDVESLLLSLMPERSAEALWTGLASEWICDVTDVGRVRCMSFSDHRGPGGVFRMMPQRAITADQLGLSRDVQALPLEPEGLVLVAGPRASGKGTLMSAFVDLINRTRRDHVITIEKEINVVHERNGSLISQREVRGGTADMVAMARAALREDPDVLVVEELRSAALMNVALDAAASGQLVIGGFPAPNASGAIDRIIDLFPSDERRRVQLALAQTLKGVVAQVLLRKSGGGRVAAREVLLNTPAVRGLLADGRTSQLPSAIEGGRSLGMIPLNDALVGYVQSGSVDVREAYRRSADRAGFVALLKRQGLDTAPLERHA
jgi:twitching motility protein PilT